MRRRCELTGTCKPIQCTGHVKHLEQRMAQEKEFAHFTPAVVIVLCATESLHVMTFFVSGLIVRGNPDKTQIPVHLLKALLKALIVFGFYSFDFYFIFY